MKRRQFIKAAGIAGIPFVAGLLSSCETVNSSNGNGNWTEDFKVMADGARAEATTIQTYKAVINANYAQGANVAILNRLNSYLQHHTDHLALFNSQFAIHDWDQINATDFSADSRLNSVDSLNGALQLLQTMEHEAAAFYFRNIHGTLTTAKVRMIFADVFPVEVGHYISHRFSLGQSPEVDGSFFQELNQQQPT